MSDWGNLAQEVEAETLQGGPTCAVARLLQGVPEADRESVAATINNLSIQASALNRALVNRLGPKAPSAYAIGRHRRQDCSCTRKG